MVVETFEITGRIPSKKNSRIITNRGRRPFSLPSSQYVKWEKEALKQVKGKRQWSVPVHISIEIVFPDKRRADLTNKAESIMDCLVKAGIIEDDAWVFVPAVTLSIWGIDKNNPRARITITSTEE